MPPSLRWTVRFVLTGDSGCPRAGLGVSWDGVFFPDGSSLASDGGLLTPAVRSAGMRRGVRAQAPHAGSESPTSPSPPSVGYLEVPVPAWEPGWGVWAGAGGRGPNHFYSKQGLDSPTPLPSPAPLPPPSPALPPIPSPPSSPIPESPALRAGNRDFLFPHQVGL